MRSLKPRYLALKPVKLSPSIARESVGKDAKQPVRDENSEDATVGNGATACDAAWHELTPKQQEEMMEKLL